MDLYGLDEFTFKARVDELVNNPVFKGFLDELEGTAISNWAATTPTDKEAREAAWQEHQAVQRIRTMVNNCKAQIDSMES